LTKYAAVELVLDQKVTSFSTLWN